MNENNSIYSGSLFSRLNEYCHSQVYPFHMPGHKRNAEILESPYTYDITEIDGFDNLHAPEGIILESMELASEFYGTIKSYYLVNGSTCGILTAICGCTSDGDEIVVDRNCHKSVYNGIYMNNLSAHYVYPQKINEYGIHGGIDPVEVERTMEESGAKVVVVTSPTYEGIVSDIRTISDIVHDKNGILIVDEAHGAHFSMHEDFPKSSIECGADVVIQSLHKTLPSLTQTAILHVCTERIDLKKIERYLGIYETSSPSYVLMSSIDMCIRNLLSGGKEIFDKYLENLKCFRKKTQNLTYIQLLDKQEAKKSPFVQDFDIGKLVIMVKSKKTDGKKVYDLLLNKYKIQLEMASKDYVIAMTSFRDTEEGFDRLANALTDIDRQLRIEEGYLAQEREEKNQSYIRPVVVMNPRKAMDSPGETVDFRCCDGRISKEYVYLYPPGIPLIVPGEMINEALIEYIKSSKEAGLTVYGIESKSWDICVVKDNWKGLEVWERYTI